MHAISRLQSHIECPICLESLASPKLLPCGHRFCKACLEQLERGREICCPLCKRTTEERTNQLPNDVLIENIKDDVERISAIVTYKHCAVCRDVDASVRCFDCQASLCETCHERHNEKHGKENYHTVIMHDPTLVCEQHEKDRAYICEDCCKVVCPCCLLQDCYGHKSQLVGVALKNYFEIRNRTIRDTEIIKNNFTPLKQNLLNVFKTTLRDIEEHSEKTIVKIQNETRSLIDSVNKLKSEALKILEATKTANDRLHDFKGLVLADCHRKIPLDLFQSLPAILKSEVQESHDFYQIKKAHFQRNNDVTIGTVYLELSNSVNVDKLSSILFGCQEIQVKKHKSEEYHESARSVNKLTCALSVEGSCPHKSTVKELFPEKRSFLSSIFW